MSETTEQKSIRSQILEAKTADEVNQVLLKITTIKGASLDTIRKWDKLDSFQMALLTPKATTVEVPAVVSQI